MHIQTHRDWQPAQGFYRFKPDGVSAPALKGRSGQRVLLTENLFVMDTHWQKKDLFSPVDSHWVLSTVLKGRPHAHK